MDTFRICDAIREAIDAKRFAAAVGRTRQTIYAWCRDPHDPEKDAERNLLDWLEAVIDALAARPAGRPVLFQLRVWVVGEIDRALGAWKPQALTREALARETSRVLREFSDLVDACGAEGFCRERIQKEGAEAIEAVERLMRAAEVGMVPEQPARGGALRAG